MVNIYLRTKGKNKLVREVKDLDELREELKTSLPNVPYLRSWKIPSENKIVKIDYGSHDTFLLVLFDKDEDLYKFLGQYK